jgi:hypothetical protein
MRRLLRLFPGVVRCRFITCSTPPAGFRLPLQAEFDEGAAINDSFLGLVDHPFLPPGWTNNTNKTGRKIASSGNATKLEIIS